MKSTVYFLALIAFMAVLTFSSPIFAQDGAAPNTGNGAQPGGAISNGTNTGVGTTTTGGFNALWLLQLIAIPVLLYLLWPRKEKEEIFDEEYKSDYAGSKGGRAESHKKEITDTDEDI